MLNSLHQFLEIPYFDYGFDFLLNIIAVSILCYGIYYKRYKDKEAVVSFMLFNIFLFTVITVLFNLDENLSLGFGFGLFAILSIIRLRSNPLSKREVTYFFGVLSLGIINAIGLNDYGLVLACNLIIVTGAWIIDHPEILRDVSNMNIKLDYIPDGILTDSEKIKSELSEKFNIEVFSYRASNIDYVNDTVKLKLSYRAHKK